MCLKILHFSSGGAEFYWLARTFLAYSAQKYNNNNNKKKRGNKIIFALMFEPKINATADEFCMISTLAGLMNIPSFFLKLQTLYFILHKAKS